MPLPEPVLDDLRFQKDLVDEARRRIIRYCPEWTDYNLSDPGITLIELFAWMTEMITYRLNRVPEKNHIRFLNMLGVQLQPPSSARTELTFWLSAPFPIRPDTESVAIVPAGTEVATQRLEEEDEVIFTTDERLRIVAPKLIQLRREEEFNKNFLPRLGIETFHAFGRGHAPQQGAMFYMGFDESNPINGGILRLSFECEETQATGIRRDDPPLVWECSLGNDQWQEILPSNRSGEKDTTGGLNNPKGRLIFYLPIEMKPNSVNGKLAHWIRCRFEQRRPEQGRYSQSPRITKITAHTMGGATWATHAVIVKNELLGRCTGEPGQVFQTNHRPVLALREGETVEVEETHAGEDLYMPWEQVNDFSQSTPYDRHFTLDPATGEINFGPSIRQPDGTMHQYGRIPEAGRLVRISAYRHGGGVKGNLPPNRLQVQKTALAYISQVTNLRRSEGGRDQESLEEAKLRARREVRAQERAVTAEDFENLGKGATREVARVHCRASKKVTGPLPPGMVELLVVPAAFDSVKLGDYRKLKLDEGLRATVSKHLDKYRLLTTTLNIREPRYLGVKVTAEIVPTEYSKPEVVRERVSEILRHYICPLAINSSGEYPEIFGNTWEGWPFGRHLYISELFSIIQQVPGVKHVLDVQLGYRELSLSEISPEPERDETESDDQPDTAATPEGAQSEKEAEEAALIPVEQRILEIPPDAILCSLEHDVRMKSL